MGMGIIYEAMWIVHGVYNIFSCNFHDCCKCCTSVVRRSLNGIWGKQNQHFCSKSRPMHWLESGSNLDSSAFSSLEMFISDSWTAGMYEAFSVRVYKNSVKMVFHIDLVDVILCIYICIENMIQFSPLRRQVNVFMHTLYMWKIMHMHPLEGYTTTLFRNVNYIYNYTVHNITVIINSITLAYHLLYF